MKKLIIIILSVSLLVMTYMSCNTQQIISTIASANLTPTTEEIVKGLKESLKLGVNSGVSVLSANGGFNKNQAIRILFPPEAQKVEKTLRDIGQGALADKIINALNEGAENAVKEAKPIFVDAITNMSIEDAMGILKGGDGAATSYLKKTTSDKLTVAFRPVIQSSLDKVGATKYWSDAINIYNKIPLVQKMNPDLNGYVTEKGMTALFNEVEKEENAIRKDPLKRSSDILKKVFGYADSQAK